MHVSESLTVSRPAMSMRKQMSRMSSFVRRSPSISAATNLDSTSSAGLLGPLVDERTEVLVDLLAGAVEDARCRASGSSMRVRVHLLGVQDAVAHVEEHPQLVLGQAHQPEEHRAREDLRELLGEVALAPVGERLDERHRPPRDVLLLLVHAAWCEERIEELAVLRVQGRVDVERDQGPDVAQAEVDLRGEELVVAQDVVDRVPVGDDDHALHRGGGAALLQETPVRRLGVRHVLEDEERLHPVLGAI